MAAIVAILYFVIYEFYPKLTPDIYADFDAKQFCKAFGLENSGERFCTGEIPQNPDTLEAMLNRHFPLNRSTYGEIAEFIDELISRPSLNCRSNTPGRYTVNNCPPPQNCDGASYSCSFSFEGSLVGMEIYFTIPDGTII